MTRARMNSNVGHRFVADEWAAASGRRADLYAWFSTVFAGELSDATVAAYRLGDAEPLLNALEASSLTAETRRLRQAIDAWTSLPFLRVELAADFARLFLLDARDAAAPYASAYLDPRHQLYGEPHLAMQHFLRKAGLKVHHHFKEPSDHLAVILASFEAWIRGTAQVDAVAQRDVATEQAVFLKDALLTWLPRFTGRCEQIRKDTASDFYPAIASLLLAFVSADAASLEAADVLP